MVKDGGGSATDCEGNRLEGVPGDWDIEPVMEGV